jgi:hypothetical protein
MNAQVGSLSSFEFNSGTQTLVTRFQDLNRDLEDFVERMTEAAGRWVLLIATELTESHYVQLLTDSEDETLLAECVSNKYLQGSDRLTEEQEELLPTLGWDWPAPPNEPNWRTVEFNPSSSLETAIRVSHTMRRVFKCSDDSLLVVKLFPGTERKFTINDVFQSKPRLQVPVAPIDQSYPNSLLSYSEDNVLTTDIEPLESLDAFDVIDGSDWSSHSLLKLIQSARDFDGMSASFVDGEGAEQREFFETLVLQFRYKNDAWVSAGPPAPGERYAFPLHQLMRIDYEWVHPVFSEPLQRRALVPRSEAPYVALKDSLGALTDEQLALLSV